MKYVIVALILFLASVAHTFSETNLKLAFSKNSFGELILTVEGHTTPVVVKIGDNTITLHVEENTVNLTALGINELTEVSVEQVDTAAGATAVPDTQPAAAPIPPVNPLISPNPPLTTPF